MNWTILNGVNKLHDEMKEWMGHLHQCPELALQETKTANFIAEKLKSWGYDVVEGIGKTGIVASMTVGKGNKTIGLRADFDALPIQEVNDLPYKSKIEGVSHLCGHDGHSTMLLGAAKYLAETKNFNGTVRLIFQPGEETMEGSPAMIADGLFERFPVDAVYGMHNMPGLPFGKFHFCENEMMAAVDNWEIELTGKGSHGSMPELSIDPVVCGSSLVMALQTIVSRNVSPWQNSVVSVGAFIAGNAGNVVPQTALLRLSIRNMEPKLREMVLNKIRSITKSQAEAFGCKYEIREGIPGAVLINTPENTQWAASVARNIFGDDQVVYPAHPYMGSEDFAFMLQKKNGTYCMLGNGDSFMVHHPQYVFNQDILPIGAAYWAALTEEYLK
ncbi:M20 aminoacylase family protein [Macellibacteroides fermentans]|uniref:M20 aminoacylase family protein n=1 Tax=Macellibacteroides fermentans TaxID=879969 RepID=UPI000836C5D1|nr:amidohydrolase [Macellibacteroides sp. HH-ZS]HML72119.1 M20 aminoacylase family protein [Macellibacteroides fermentans]